MDRCIVVSASEPTRSSVAATLEAMGLNALPLASLGELPHALAETSACGVLLELATFITAPHEEKKAAQELLEIYPSAKFRFAERQVLIVGETLDSFVQRCRQFAPRSMRKHAREARHLAVYLSPDEGFADAEKCVTLDVSEGGYFVYSVRLWNVGDHVWLKFPDQESVLSGIVRSFRPWGNNRFLPGIGVQVDQEQPEW